MKRVLVVGGANGIGLAIATELASKETCEKVYIVDKSSIPTANIHKKFECCKFDLNSSDYSIFDEFRDIDSLVITAGFGRLALFKDVSESYIVDSFNVNSIAPIRIISKFMDKLMSNDNFYCCVMVSIAGFMSSPFFAVYGATKAALKIFIESVNVEIEKSGSRNRILNVSPGSIPGTSFNHATTNLSITKPLAQDIIFHIENQEDLFIPKFDEVFREVLERYHADFRAEGRHSYEYKLNTGRITTE
jgi:short-subunit dehydrogenase